MDRDLGPKRGQYLMLGDNRDNSQDSRVWGPAREEKIVGKAVAVWMHKDPGFEFPTFYAESTYRIMLLFKRDLWG